MSDDAFVNISASQRKEIEEVAALLPADRRILVVTGAGMSAESGLPTYRGTGGLYNSGATAEGMTIEEILCAGTFREKPALTWKYLGEIGRAGDDKLPNPGHFTLAQWERRFSRLCILTQNIDGLHTRAGSENVIEIHGNMRRLECRGCGATREVSRFADIPIPPTCDSCNGIMRPGVVLFDELLPTSAVNHLAGEWQKGFDVVFSIGTTSSFPYIAEPVLYAARHGLPAIEINLSGTTVTSCCSHVIDLPASVALDEIAKRLPG